MYLKLYTVHLNMVWIRVVANENQYFEVPKEFRNIPLPWVYVVCCPPIYSGRQTPPFRLICGQTSRGHTGGRPHRRVFFPPSFCGACLIFLPREGFSCPIPSSTMRSNFVYPPQNRSPFVEHDGRENPSSCDCTEIRTHVPTSEGFNIKKKIEAIGIQKLGANSFQGFTTLSKFADRDA